MKTKTVHHFSKKKIPRAFLAIPLVLLFSAFVMRKSIVQYQTSRVAQELSANAQEAVRSEGVFQPGQQTAYFLNEPVSPLSQPLAERSAGHSENVLGETSSEKWIDVDLATQTLKAMEGDRTAYQFLVSTGKWAPTPTGEFRIWSKFKYTKMSGGSKELNTYYYLPNVPYVMFFHNGFGIHGAYWHNNFGHPMSHGCVNMSIVDAEKLFYWAGPVLAEGKSSGIPTKENPGTRVVVHGESPKS